MDAGGCYAAYFLGLCTPDVFSHHSNTIHPIYVLSGGQFADTASQSIMGRSLKNQEIVVLEWTSSRQLKSRCKQQRYEPLFGIEGLLSSRDLQLTVGTVGDPKKGGKSQVGMDVLIWERQSSGMSDDVCEDGTVTGWFADATDGSLSPEDNLDLVIGYNVAGKSPSQKQFDDWPIQQREGRLHPVLVPKGDDAALVFTDVYNKPALPTREEYAAAAATNDYSLNTPTKAIQGMREGRPEWGLIT